ncbi:MAG TPA: hypothetical protein VF593_06600 [Chthoniobacteraceae bacterium]|jgi:hypothetical protein
MFRFPLEFHFPFFRIAPTIVVTDSSGAEVCFVRQKLFRLKEAVTVHRDSSQQTVLGTIKADRIIDWSARYTFSDAEGQPFGAVGRRGAKSLWRSHYDIFSRADSKEVSMTIQEENPFAKIFDSLLGQIPILGVLTAYLFHPRYAVRTADGTIVARLTKRAALLEGKFTLEQLGDLQDEQSLEILLSCLMMLLLERNRG